MTFTDIVAMAATDLNITQASSITRIGTHVNRRYRKIMRRLGLSVFSRVEFDFVCTPGTQTQTVLSSNTPVITRIVNIFYQPTPTTKARKLEEYTYDELRVMIANVDPPRYWAKKKMASETVTFMIDSTVPNGLTLALECEATKSTLAGTDVPGFSEEFHEILVVGAKADELLKMEKPTLAREFKTQFEEDLNELAYKAVVGAALDIVQNKHFNDTRFQSR